MESLSQKLSCTLVWLGIRRILLQWVYLMNHKTYILKRIPETSQTSTGSRRRPDFPTEPQYGNHTTNQGNPRLSPRALHILPSESWQYHWTVTGCLPFVDWLCLWDLFVNQIAINLSLPSYAQQIKLGYSSDQTHRSAYIRDNCQCDVRQPILEYIKPIQIDMGHHR